MVFSFSGLDNVVGFNLRVPVGLRVIYLQKHTGEMAGCKWLNLSCTKADTCIQIMEGRMSSDSWVDLDATICNQKRSSLTSFLVIIPSTYTGDDSADWVSEDRSCGLESTMLCFWMFSSQYNLQSQRLKSYWGNRELGPHFSEEKLGSPGCFPERFGELLLLYEWQLWFEQNKKKEDKNTRTIFTRCMTLFIHRLIFIEEELWWLEVKVEYL